MRVELRVVVAIGFAVAVWLLLVPGSHPLTGQSCGIPVAGDSPNDPAGGNLPPECDDVNATRKGQAGGTALLTGALLGGHALVRFVRDGREARAVEAMPAHRAGWWDAE